MIAVWILLETGNQIIHQALGRNFHPPPGGIAIGEIIAPLVIGLLGDLALPQRVGRCLPFVQHPVQLSRLLAVTKIHPQANITIRFLYIQAVPVFQGEKSVHETNTGIIFFSAPWGKHRTRRRSGMSVYKDNKTNTWRVIYRYTDWTGEQKQSSRRGFASKHEAQAWEAQLMTLRSMPQEETEG